MILHYRRYGDAKGIPLVLLHGLMGSHDNWHSLAGRMGAKRRVYAMDLRNHGRSPHAESMDYQSMAADVIESLDAEAIPEADVVGHSMGGKVAMEIAVGHPSRVHRLAVEDSVPGRTPPRYRSHIEALRSLDLTTLKTRKQAEESLKAAISDRLMLLFLLKNLVRDSNGGYTWRANVEGIYRNYDRITEGLGAGRRFEGPAIFLAGALSDVVTKSAEKDIRNMFPAGEIVRIEKAGHWVHADAPEVFLDTLHRFLGKA